MRITTVSSGRITTQALISGAASAARAASTPNGMRMPSESPPPAAMAALRKERRFSFTDVIAGLRSRLGSQADGLARLLVGAAAADIRNGAVDVGVARLRVILEQRGDRHDHAALAVAALRHVVVEPGLLHLVQFAVGGEPLDRRDLLGHRRIDRHGARAGRDSLDVHSAGAALSDPTAVFRSGQAKRVTQDPEERHARIDIGLVILAVDVERNHHSTSVTRSTKERAVTGALLPRPGYLSRCAQDVRIAG